METKLKLVEKFVPLMEFDTIESLLKAFEVSLEHI